ncbi:MAG: sugar phosphate isomerase/epimerase [Lachnospiraceae bacterium]|nr:sugar phosphate isomerase/epimerase [Lachnospiraceae bacterium]
MALKVGLILYSVREEMAKDPYATVRKVGECGYKYIETCNHKAQMDNGCGFGVPAEDLKKSFDEFGAQVVSAHVFPIEWANLKEVAAYNRVLGNTNIVNPNSRFSTYDDLMKQLEDWNKWGKILADEGMHMLYHNHNQEFRTIKGKAIEDYIVENTDPAYVSLELDTFWTMRAGLDPVDVIKKYGKRIRLIHQKDFAWDSLQPINLNGLTPEEWEMKEGEFVGTDGATMYDENGNLRSMQNMTEERKEQMRIRNSSFTEIGFGIMHIQDIIDAANEYSEAKYIILEQDYTRLPSQIDGIIKSMEGFKKLTGIEWS